MLQKITGFHKDMEEHWVAELECGHGCHFRHEPPWMERPWVLSADGRDSRLGQMVNCVRCDFFAAEIAKSIFQECRQAMVSAYETGGISGLCHEGRWDLALDALQSLEATKIKIDQ